MEVGEAGSDGHGHLNHLRRSDRVSAKICAALLDMNTKTYFER